MPAATITVTNPPGRGAQAGLSFTFRVVRQGDHYGSRRALTHTESEPAVEGFDCRYAGNHKFDPLGQFVTRANLPGLLTHGGGIWDLHGGAPAWTADRAPMERAWLWTLSL